MAYIDVENNIKAKQPLDTNVAADNGDGNLTVPGWLIFLFLALYFLQNALQESPRSVAHLRTPLPSFAPSFARHAFLLYGEVRTLREGLTSQLKLFEASEGGLDIYAVLSPTTTHMMRTDVLPNASADASEIEWLRTLPCLRALHLLEVGHHNAFIKLHLPGFPWTDQQSPYFVPQNIVAAFLKRKLVWQLMEETLRNAGAAAHRYDVIVIGRPDLRVPTEQSAWPHGINLGDFTLSGALRGMDSVDFVPGQPDSWAPEENTTSAQRSMTAIFVDSFHTYTGVLKSSDLFGFGDWTAVYYYCHAIDFMLRLCTEEKGGPEHKSPVVVDPGILLGHGIISAAREATRRARKLDPAAPAHGIRFTQLKLKICLGKSNDDFSLDTNLSGCTGPAVPVD
jgi:hypothetical protein